MVVLYVLIVLALIQGLVSLRDGVRNMRYALLYRPASWNAGHVVVFCPVKGADEDLAPNARSLLDQEYGDYRVVFLIDRSDDPAASVLGGIEGAEIMVGGRSQVRGQKVHNLLEGIARIGAEASVFVFADADARFPKDWLGQLVAPLGDPAVGAATGYRWYVPEPGNPVSLIRSAWNASVAGFLGPHAHNFTWGGSTAIRREVFFEAGIDRLWQYAVSDDYALTHGVRRHGLRIEYVPTCLVPAYGTSGWRELIEFTTRQIRITRVYGPAVWWMGLVSYTLFNVTFFWTAAAVVAGAWLLAAPLGLIYLLTLVRSEVRLRGVAPSIAHSSLRRYRWFYRLSGPVVALLYQFNFVASAMSRRIVWKNVVYTMVSPGKTRVEFR